MSELLRQENSAGSPDLTLKGFIDNFLNKNVLDKTIKEMFKEIYFYDKKMATDALESLEYSDGVDLIQREDLLKELADWVLEQEKK